MIKLPPRIFVNHIKGEGLETVGVYRTYSSKGYRVLNAEYIRRDLIQAILDYVGVITYEPLENIIDKIIAEEQSGQ